MSPTWGATGADLAAAIRTAAGGGAWHGPSLREAIEGVGADAAAEHPIPGAHSIWELVLHLGAWAEIVRERVRGGAVELSPERNFPPVGAVSAVGWARAVDGTMEAIDALAEEVAGLDPDALAREEDGRIHGVQIRGTVEHVIYHAGQIAILRRALGLEPPAS